MRSARGMLGLAAVLLALAAPAGALAQSPLTSPLPPAPQQPTPTVAPAPSNSTSSSNSSGLNGTQEALIIAAGIVLLLGIGWAIVRDARSRAPVAEHEHIGGESTPRRSSQQQARERARAKAARQQRKRNRARR